jgi:hypothetical protein
MSGNFYQTDDFVEPVDSIEKHTSLLYSVDSGISLSLKELPKLRGSSPFFGTKWLNER